MFTRMRLWLAVPAALALALAFAGEPSLDFIHLTDTHVCDLHRAAPGLAAARDHFESSAESLASFFEAFSGEAGRPYRPAFFLITGDLTDAFRFHGAGGEWVEGQVEAFRRVAERSPAPLYLALGNHDIMGLGLANGRPDPDESAAAAARAAWMASAPCFKGGTWYSFEKQVGATSYVFVVLDIGYTEGAMAQKQWAWLKRQAERQGPRAMIVAMHTPLGEDAQSKAIKAALAPARAGSPLPPALCARSRRRRRRRPGV
jgi:3',5'-cyclic AMP phosphodiesterase CpdA